MTKSSHWLVASVLACFAALSACSSKNSNTGGNGSSTGNTGNAVACLAQSLSGACQSCIQGSCEGALGAFASDCSDYLQCYCPNGSYNGSAQTSQACISKVTANPSCLSSAQSVNSCLQQSCTSACQQSSGSSSGASSGGGGSGGSGGGGSSGAGGTTPACGVVFTTATCASCVMAKCCSVTQSCASDEGCLGIITCIHGCNGDTKCEQNCVTSAPTSAQMELNNAGACWTSSCNNSGC